MKGSSCLWGPATGSPVLSSLQTVILTSLTKCKILRAPLIDGETEAPRSRNTAWQHMGLSSLMRVFYQKEVQKGIWGHQRGWAACEGKSSVLNSPTGQTQHSRLRRNQRSLVDSLGAPGPWPGTSTLEGQQRSPGPNHPHWTPESPRKRPPSRGSGQDPQSPLCPALLSNSDLILQQIHGHNLQNVPGIWPALTCPQAPPSGCLAGFPASAHWSPSLLWRGGGRKALVQPHWPCGSSHTPSSGPPSLC